MRKAILIVLALGLFVAAAPAAVEAHDVACGTSSVDLVLGCVECTVDKVNGVVYGGQHRCILE